MEARQQRSTAPLFVRSVRRLLPCVPRAPHSRLRPRMVRSRGLNGDSNVCTASPTTLIGAARGRILGTSITHLDSSKSAS